MSNIASIPSLTEAVSTATTSSESADTLGQDAFLKLLTVQLQNQDPLDPMSNEDFVAQLAQFSSLEELMGIQTGLEAVYLGITSMNNATMAGLVGTNVVAYGDTVNYAGEGDETLHYDASSAVDNLTLTITNEEGDVVRTVELGGAEAGEGSYTWDGTDKDGNQMPEGEYTFSFSGTDSEGNDILVDEIMHGTITEMDYSTGVPLPSVDGILISLGDIMRLTTEAEPTEPAES